MISWLISALSFLETKPVGDTAIRDTLGNTVPKTLLTRTKEERIDVATSQVGNTLAFVGGGLSVDAILRKSFEKFQTKGATEVAQHWATLSRSIGIYSAMMSSMWAMPFIRNYITTKRTGMVNYADVIKSGGAPKGPQSPEQKAAVDASLKDSKKKALTILGSGAAGIILPIAFGRWAASQGLAKEGIKGLFNYQLKFPGLKGRFEDKLLLAGGKFEKLGGWPSMLFWGIPAYIGWYHASRDPYEKKEVFVRCANFIACFSLPPMLAKQAFEAKLNKALPQLMGNVNFSAIKDALTSNLIKKSEAEAAQKLLIGQNVIGMGSSIILLGVTPQLLNMYLTKRRMAKEAVSKDTPKADSIISAAKPAHNPVNIISPMAGYPQQPSLAPSWGNAVPGLVAYPAQVPTLAPASPMMNNTQTLMAQRNCYNTGLPVVGLGSRPAFR